MGLFRDKTKTNPDNIETITDETRDYMVESTIMKHMKERGCGKTILYKHLRSKYGSDSVNRTLNRIYKRNQRKNSTMNKERTKLVQENQSLNTKSITQDLTL